MYRLSPLRSDTYIRARPRNRVPTRAHTHAHRWCRRARRAAPHRRPAERVRDACGGAPPADSGAYLYQGRGARSVPRADVRVERRRRPERLQAEPHAVHADGKGFRGSAWIRARPHQHAHALAHMPCRAVTSAHARDRTCASVTQQHKRLHLLLKGVHRYIYIYTYI